MMLPPEVHGAIVLAVRANNRAASDKLKGRTVFLRKERLRRLREKVQKHIARALKYQANRE